MKNKYAAIFNLVEEGTDLLPLTKRRPVATLPIASRYRLIDFPFSSLSNAKARSAALFMPGSGRSLYDHVRAGNTWGLDNEAGGGLFTHSQIKMKKEKPDAYNYYYRDHRDYLDKGNSKYVILLGSNILANLQIDPMLAYHLEEENDLTVAYKNIKRNELREDTIFSHYIFEDANGKKIKDVQPLAEVPVDETTVKFGMNVLIATRELFMDYLDQLQENNDFVSVNNILNLAIKNEEIKIGGYEYTGYLKAIEDIASYFAANMDMLDEDHFNALFYRESPVLTKSKNSAPTYYGKDSNVKNAQFANDCEVYGEVKNSIIFRRSFICQDAKVTNSILLQSSFVDEGAELNYVILDKQVYVEKGAKLEGTAENPIVVPKRARVLSNGDIVEG